MIAAKKPANFKQIKNQIKRAKGQKKNLYWNLKGAYRRESYANEQKREFARRYATANTQYRLNPTAAGFDRVRALYKQYTDARERHVETVNVLNTVKGQVNELQIATTLQMNQVSPRPSLSAPKRPQVARPNFNPRAQVRNRRTGVAMAPNARAMLQASGPVVQRGLAPAVQNPPPIGNPANFPAAALAQQRARELNNAAARFERAQVDRFMQQNPQQAPAQAGNGNNQYVRPDARPLTYGPPPAAASGVHVYSPPPSQPFAQQRPVIQNQYDVVRGAALGQNNRINTAPGQQVAPTQPRQIGRFPDQRYEQPNDGPL